MGEAPELRWLWNGDLSVEHLRAQLMAMRRRGVRAAVAWPWAGLQVRFLSAEYLERLTAACEAAAAAGMSLWLADDLHWPSGTAGGRLLLEHPEHAQRALACTSRWAGGDAPQEVRWEGEGEQLVVATALDQAGGRRDLARQLEESALPVPETRRARYAGYTAEWPAQRWSARLHLPAGNWFVTIATLVKTNQLLPSAVGTPWSSHRTGSLDTLSEAAVAAFVRLSLERLVRATAPWHGSVVKGIVTVPPSALPAADVRGQEGWRCDVLPWTADLPALFLDRFGKPLAAHLPYVLAPLHQGQHGSEELLAAVRELATARHARAYVETVREFCTGHGLALRTLTPAEVEAMPAVPFSLAGLRKQVAPPSSVVALQLEPQDGAQTAAHQQRQPPGAAGTALPAGGGRDRPPVPPEPGTLEALDILPPAWQWTSHSLNVHPLAAWSEWRPVDAERYTLAASFDADYLPPDLLLVFEPGLVRAVALNGVDLPLHGARRPRPDEIEFADPCLRVLPLWGLGAACTGTNALEARAVLPEGEQILIDRGATLGPLWLAGSFALKEPVRLGDVRLERRGPAALCLSRPVGLLATGNWCLAGYPRYSGTATYRQSFVVPALPADAPSRLLVDAFGGRVTASINGQPVGGPCESPASFDIAGRCAPGVNRLEIACSSTLAPRLAGGAPAGLARVQIAYRHSPAGAVLPDASPARPDPAAIGRPGSA